MMCTLPFYLIISIAHLSLEYDLRQQNNSYFILETPVININGGLGLGFFFHMNVLCF